MPRHIARLVLLSFAGCVAAALAHAGEEVFDIDPRFRAKIAKEKIKEGAAERKFRESGASGDDGAQCGSQNIGNVNTGGKPGAPAPREVFVFAPNAINLVNGRGCR